MVENRPGAKGIWAWTTFVGVLLALEAVLFYAFVGRTYSVADRPATPITVDRANQLFSSGIHPGQSQESVEAWLASQGIKRGSPWTDAAITYDVWHRDEDPLSESWWMDIARRAGLDSDSAFSVIRVSYPDAARLTSGRTIVTVYLFFDRDDRLLRHSVDENHVTL
jgi:hypothetical protein